MSISKDDTLTNKWFLNNSVYNLKLFESKWISSDVLIELEAIETLKVQRIPQGFLYTTIIKRGKQMSASTVFVKLGDKNE